MFAGGESKFGRLEVPIVGRRDADRIYPVSKQLGGRIVAGEAGEVGNFRTGLLFVLVRTAARPTGYGSQLNVNQTKVAAIKSLSMCLFEKRAIGVIKNHAQADHAGAKAVLRDIHGFHFDMIAGQGGEANAGKTDVKLWAIRVLGGPSGETPDA